MKKLIQLSLENKSLNHLLFIFLITLAFISYGKIAKEMFPPNSLDMVTVQGYYTGASSTILDKLIVRDVEKILRDNQNLEDINTLISNGSFHVNAKIKNSTSKIKIVNNIKNEVEILKKDLPSDMDLPVVDTVESFFPLINISISSNLNKNYIEVSKLLRDEIKSLKNLHSVSLDGNYEPLLIVSLNEQKLKAYNLSKEKALNVLKSLYSLYPIGTISSKKQKYYLSTKNENVTINQVLNSQVKIDSTLIYLKDIATIKYDYEKRQTYTKTNGKKSVTLNIKKAKLGDSIALSKRINLILESYKKEYKDIDFKVLSDSSFWIKTRLNVISSNIIVGLILLFFAIWVFISLKIALVVILGIPISFAFGLIGLDFFSASLNTLSMIGVLLSLGLLVDEAIVVSENIHRHRLLGKSIKDACIEGTYEVMPILFASMLTTIIAFLPLTMLSGGLGLFIKIIPLVVIILILSSFIESFIFLPLHYKLLSFGIFKDESKSYKDIFWEKICMKYKKSLEYFMKHKYIWSFLLVFFTVFSSYTIFKSSKFQLFPEFDAMTINITGKVKNNSLDYTLEKTKLLENELIKNLDTQNVASISTIIGMNSDGRSKHDRGENLFTITLNLKQKISDDYFNTYINKFFLIFENDNNTKRTRTLYAKQIQENIYKLTNDKNLVNDFLEFNINIPQTGVVKSDIVISISHHDNNKIQKSLQILKDKISEFEHIYNVKDDMAFDELKVELDINAYGKNLGFNQNILVEKVRSFVSQKDLSKVIDSNASLVELKVEFLNQNSINSLKTLSLEVPSSDKLVSLQEIANLSFIKDITTIKKDNLKKIFTLSASIKKRKMSSRKFYKNIRPTLKKIEEDGIEIFIKGEEKTNNQIKKDILISILFAIFGILIVLTWLFSSLRHAIFALTVIPLSILGVLLGHKLMNMNISFSSLLGYVGLIGIVINDTLIMLKFIKNSDNKEELLEKASLRVRPILLTSITTILGLSTLIFFASGESLLMQPLAVSIGFGLLYATIINLYYIPLMYSFLKKYNTKKT